jgi:hypothetical protein
MPVLSHLGDRMRGARPRSRRRRGSSRSHVHWPLRPAQPPRDRHRRWRRASAT